MNERISLRRTISTESVIDNSAATDRAYDIEAVAVFNEDSSLRSIASGTVKAQDERKATFHRYDKALTVNFAGGTEARHQSILHAIDTFIADAANVTAEGEAETADNAGEGAQA